MTEPTHMTEPSSAHDPAVGVDDAALLVPELAGVPEDDQAEPRDAGTTDEPPAAELGEDDPR